MDILNEKIEGLVKKAEKSGMPYSILKKVYDRGMAAWKTGHRPGTTPQQWAFARVNSFVTKSSGTWGKADKDLADKVRGAKKEEIENPKNAKDILGQIREARYKIGFEKGEVDMVISDRPGELALIVQDELDSERIRAKVKSTGDEFTLEFNTNIPQRKMIKILDDKFGYTAFAESKELVKEKLPKDADAGDYVKDFRKSKAPQFKGKSDKKIQKMAIAAYLDSKEENIQESGHTDVASMKTQVQIAMDALQKMQMNLGKLTDEDDLPTWWTNKVATAVNKLDGMADYIDAMHDRGKEMSEQFNLEEDICDGNIRLNEGRMKELAGYIARGMSAREIAKKMKIDVKTIEKLMKEEKRQLKDPKKETMVMKVKDASSIIVIDKKDLKKYTSKGYIQVESNLQEKEMTYTVVHIKKGKEVIKAKSSYDAAKKFAKMKGLKSTAGVDAHLMEDNITEETVFVIRFEKEGMRFATPFRRMQDAKDGEKILKKSAGVSNISITKDILKPGIKFSEGRIVKEENLMEIDGIIQIDTKNSRISKQLAYHLRYDLPSEFRDIPLEIDGGEQGNTRFFMSPDMDTRDVKKFAAYLKKKYGNSIKLQLEGVEQEEWMLDENSLAAQATRVISQTAIREKKDPADIDMTATDLDRKAADKNIFVQLKRAQDMKGKGDVEFLDKKKKKVDIRIINKAIDMMMKMKPADRAKMQTAIGKSYKDLLKTVQRGKV